MITIVGVSLAIALFAFFIGFLISLDLCDNKDESTAIVFGIALLLIVGLLTGGLIAELNSVKKVKAVEQPYSETKTETENK